jgi:predicted nucleic acid-binding protein
MLEEDLRPTLEWIALTNNDWSQAARLWADTVKRGRQLSDVDLLIAAIATRLDAIIVSSDTDFDALPVKRENWRTPPPSSGS